MDDDPHRQPFAVDQGVDFAAIHLLAGVVAHLAVSAAPFSADLTDWAHLKLAGLALWPIGKMIGADRGARCGHYSRYTL